METKEQNKSEEPLFTTEQQQEQSSIFETMEQQVKPENPVLEHNTLFFLTAALIYSVCFAVAFYKNYAGLTFPLITIATLAVCGLFLKKSGVLWKTQNLYYVIPIILLGISNMLTTSVFILFFNTVGILLLITVFMMQQVYADKKWNMGQYFCNMLFLYICMIPEVAAPFSNLGKYIRRKKITKQKNTNTKYIVMGVLIGLPMLAFVLVLLSSADAIFSEYIGEGFLWLWDNIVFSPNIVLVVTLIIIGFFGIYTFLSALTLNNMPEWSNKKQKKNPITAVTFISMITVVYLIFSVIQIIFLFSGGMILPEGYTYAEYAHQGFFQLLFLCIFNLILVLLCISLFEMSKWLKTILLIFSGCTYVMIASSACRMLLYISSYHLTFLRVLVLWFLLMLVFLMAGVVGNIIKKEFSLFRYEMVVVTVFYLVFSFARPDYWIAKYNISQIGNEMSYTDVFYLCNLSSDAVPALTELHPEHEHDKEKYRGWDEYSGQEEYYWECPACKLESYLGEVEENTDLNIRNFNLSTYQAVKAAEEYLE